MRGRPFTKKKPTQEEVADRGNQREGDGTAKRSTNGSFELTTSELTAPRSTTELIGPGMTDVRVRKSVSKF